MKKLLLVLAIVLFTTSAAQSAENRSFITSSSAFVPESTETLSAAESKTTATSPTKTVSFGRDSDSITCNKQVFTIQVVSQGVGGLDQKKFNETRRKGVRIIKECIRSTKIVNGKIVSAKTVSNADTAADGVGVRVSIPKAKGWLDAFKDKVSFNTLVSKRSSDSKKDDSYDTQRAACLLRDKTVAFFVALDTKGKVLIKTQCGEEKQETPEQQRARLDELRRQGSNGPNGYDTGGTTDPNKQPEWTKQTADQAAGGQGPTNHGYQQGQPSVDPYNPDSLQQLQDYNPDGGITVGPEGDEGGTLGDELDDWGEDWGDDGDADYGQEYEAGEGTGKASPDDANVYAPIFNDEFEDIDASLYRGEQVQLTNDQIRALVGDLSGDQESAIQDELYAFGDIDYTFFDLESAEAKIEEKFGGDWWLDFDPNLSFEQTVDCNYVRIDTCAYPNLTQDDYDLMSAITQQYSTSLNSWDFNSTYLEEPKKDELSCSWFGSCWWQSLSSWWSDTNPAGDKYDQ